MGVDELSAANGHLPALVEADSGVSLATWLASNHQAIRDQLCEIGAILFRGFSVPDAKSFAHACQVFAKPLLPYTERTAPRIQVSPGVYTSTEHPNGEKIELHNANSYSHKWPRWIWFYCDREPESGGNTSIASSAAVLKRLESSILDKFREHGVRYMRNFRNGMGISWQESFGTEDSSEVRAYCDEAQIEIDRFDGNDLRTFQVRPALRTHPDTMNAVWFNQAHLFHSSSLRPELRKALLRTYGEDGMPRSASFGDGTPITDEIADHLRDCLDSETVLFDWQQGDVLLLDNMLVAHGRSPYTGSRRILVSFAELYTCDS
ncbi:MAG: TauD/TfdA family dioxygenase [bacterium]|nr:TauD/TfdA family dioxygenase [bacterium]